MLRHFTVGVVMLMGAACASVPANASGFLVAIDDVPLMAGLVEQPEPVIFESENGRVVRTSAEGQADGARISAFYEASLPQLGWTRTADTQALAYERENETLRIAIREPANNQPVRVSFELIVKLASSRLPE